MDLNACGVVVAHAAGSKDLCKTVLGELLVHLERMLALPGSISSGLPERHFLRFATSPATAIKEASHRHDFMMPLSPSVEALLRSVVSGSVGASLLATVGQDAKLCELTGIICEPSAASQAVHSDGSWTASGPRLIQSSWHCMTLWTSAWDPHASTVRHMRHISSQRGIGCLPLHRKSQGGNLFGLNFMLATVCSWISLRGTAAVPIHLSSVEYCSPSHLWLQARPAAARLIPALHPCAWATFWSYRQKGPCLSLFCLGLRAQ